MAIQKPYGISLKGVTIDAKEENTVSWQVSGDVQTAYKIDILLNSTGALVWSSGKLISYGLKHTIPPNTLTNGNEYKITVTIFNQANESAVSDAEIFQTSSRPVVTLSPVGTVNSFSYKFTATYTQAENVPIRHYTVFLYDDQMNLIDKSGILTGTPLEYMFSNLQAEHYYHVEFQVVSAKGLINSTGKQRFYTFYLRPKMNVNLQASNIENAGIELSWYISQIIMKNTNGTFIGNEKIDLRANGSKIVADTGFETDVDFTMKLWIENPNSKIPLMRMDGVNGTITLSYDAVRQRYKINKFIGDIHTKWESNECTTDKCVVTIQQINKEFNITANHIHV